MIEFKNYNIYFNEKNLNKLEDKIKSVYKGNKLFIITDKTVFKLYNNYIKDILTNYELVFIFVNKKSFINYFRTINKLFKQGFSKSDLLVALGGGMVGDITGFIASTIYRGVDYIQIPTTLLSQVDSSIGSKTAIDTKYGKNLVGTFYEPKMVFIDTMFLDSLSKREYNNGFAEVIKMALLYSESYFNRIKNKELLSLEDIKEIVNFKKTIVEQDPFDKGLRRILNFGHTFGHAIEKTNNYHKFKHGEAISHGMLIALEIGIKLNKTKEYIYDEVNSILNKKRLISKNIKNYKEYFVDLKYDKKNDYNGLNFIILNDVAKYEIIVLNEEDL